MRQHHWRRRTNHNPRLARHSEPTSPTAQMGGNPGGDARLPFFSSTFSAVNLPSLNSTRYCVTGTSLVLAGAVVEGVVNLATTTPSVLSLSHLLGGSSL